MTSRFSTGIPDFDRFLGGLRPGDTVLLCQASAKAAIPLWNAFLDHLRKADTPVVYLCFNGSREYLLTGVRHAIVRLPLRSGSGSGRTGGWPSGLPNLSKVAKPGSVLIMDDLSDMKGAGRAGGLVAAILEKAADWAGKNKGLLITTCLKSGLDPEELATLKEISTICLDITHTEGALLCTPVSLRERYPAAGVMSFGFRITGKGGGKKLGLIPVQDFQSPHGEKIRREIREMEETAEQLFSGPLGNSPFGLWIADLQGSFAAVNDRLREICAVSPGDEGGGLPDPLRLVASSDRRRFLRYLSRAKKSGHGVITVSITPEGRKAEAVRIRAMRSTAGLTLFLVEREGDESEGTLTHGDIESPRSAACVTDRKKIHRMSPALRGMLGVLQSSGPMTQLGSCFPLKTVKAVRQAMDAIDAGDQIAPFQGLLKRHDGTELPVRLSIDPAEDEAGRFILSVEDISEFSGTIAKLEVTDRLYRSIAEGVSRPVALLDGLKIAYVNPAFSEMSGVPEGAKAAGMTLDQQIAPEERAGFTEAFAKFLSSRQTSRVFEATVLRKEGAPIAGKLTVRKLQSAPGAVPGAGLVLELEDVTDVRREAARLAGLHDGVERVASILEAATSTPDYQRLIHVALDRSLEILGWTGGAVYLHDQASQTFRIALSKHIPKKLLEQISEVPAGEGLGGYVAKTLESHILSLSKYPSYLPFGRLFREHDLRWISLVPLVHADGASGFILGLSGSGAPAGESSLGTLTTLGRQLGNALANARKLEVVRASEGRLQTVVESLSGIVYNAAPDGSILTIDAAVASALGYSPRDFGRNRSLFLSLIHEADKKIYLERVTAGESLGKGFVREYRIRPKAKAAFRWMRDTVSVMRDPEGRIVGFTGILSDVTADREKFDAVLSEHTILRTVQDVLPEGIAVFDEGGVCVDWNPVMERLTGTPRAAAIGRRAENIAPIPDSLGAEGLGNAVAARRPARLGMVSPSAEPSSWYELFLVAVPGRGDSGPGFLLRYADVSARQAELDNLLQSEKILLNVINAMDDVMMITDLNGRVVEVNQAFLRVMRYPRSGAVGQEFPYPWLVEKDMSRFLLWISKIRERQWLHDFDVSWMTHGGEELQMSLNTTLIRNSLGEPVAMLNIARDITERVRLGREVEARTSQLEMINRIVTLGNRGDEFGPVFRAAADEIVRMMPAHAVFIVSKDGGESPWARTAVFDGGELSNADAARFVAALYPDGPVGPGVPDGGGGQAGSDRGAGFVVGDTERETEGRRPEGDSARFRSAVVLPIEEAGGVTSRLAVASREPHAFGDENAEQLRPVASQLGMIIGRIKLFRQVVADSSFVAGLLDAIDSPVYTLGPDRTISRVNRAAAEFLRSSVRAERGPLEGARIFDLLDASPLTEALERALSRIAGGDGRNAVEEVELAGTPDPVTIRLSVSPLGDVTGSAGYVISHTDISSLKAQVGRLSALFDLSRRLTSLLETKEIYPAVFEHVRRVVPCERCTISVFAEHGGAPVTAFRAVRTGDEYRIEIRPAVDDGDTPPPPELHSGAVSIMGRGDTAVVPMASEADAIGVIVVTRGDGVPFDEVQVRLLESFGSLAAIAVQKAGLYEETVRTTEKVERRNRELDDFTYVVSHDLKEPLISIEGFSRILQMDYSSVIRAEGREYLDSLVGAATRMKGLIDDLLMLSRVSRPMESFGDVDISTVVDEVRTDMEFVIRKKNIEFRVAPGLPTVQGNGTQLSILFRNLIGNAVKFNDKPVPVVEVGFQNQGNNSYLFWVKDNGIGIEPAFYEKIFVIFQRLHRREEFEGSGAGLAIVRKIIEIHQGSIWLESRIGEGSTFFFTLPAAATG